MNRRTFLTTIVSAGLYGALPTFSVAQSNRPLFQLAANYEEGLSIKDYLVSEKLDGVRAYWNGRQLVSRSGNFIDAPKWFTGQFPNTALDGELWAARGSFHDVMDCLRDAEDEQKWQRVRYMAFDLPEAEEDFVARVSQLNQITLRSESPYLDNVDYFEIHSEAELMALLNRITVEGAEGLMLRKKLSRYVPGRNDELIKLKKHEDAEALVLEHLPGKGKFQNMMGALLVQTAEGRIFRIGSGFSEAERRKPPKLGSLITYKFYGLTHKGTPRFASFLREYADI